ncbi:MAG: Asp-tRNA(Asn)/Glu-tRNA(Gln) amidotransferase subunit GatC [Alphaproteobacteria bacterium]|jgi:aspartyl-tRNA(Asn)/glutamyl-tRNA(Gln) amidotransferase subunit C|nr:Asp-tRNA(Asn)/Glu-tRNA(Gln) amidotransferase subunit GatC [Alphaproteobacteria bacterium]MBT5861036.1 Asp-tRNA(Asn)/Glu-tRNA(Gln) amidotransferase subunit GatC [Alphaproteobacteria bacterium]
MALDKATVAKIAHLARLRVADDRLEGLASELSNILTWIEHLEEVDTEGVTPMSSVVEANLRQREDAITDGAKADDILANAPGTAAGFFTVPKVVE